MLLVLLALLVSTPAVAAGTLVFEGSVDHADYGESESTVLSAALAWRAPRWSLSVTVPGVRQTAPVLLRVGPMTVPGGENRPAGSPDGPSDGSSDSEGDPGGEPDGHGGGTGGDGGSGGSDGHEGNGDGGNGGGDNGNGNGNGGSGNGDGNGDGGDGNGGSGNGDGGGGSGSTGGGLSAGPTAHGEAQHEGESTETERVLEDRSGLGDPVIRLDLALPGVLGGGVRWGLFGAAKVPVADEDLGTEEWDFGAGLLLWRTGLLTDVYLELGYWVLGDPEDFELDDPVSWRAFVTRRLASGEWAFAALTQGTTEVVDGVGSSAEAGVWAGRFFGGRSAHRSVGLSAVAGLDEGAPDWSVTLSWRLGVAGLRPEHGP